MRLRDADQIPHWHRHPLHPGELSASTAPHDGVITDMREPAKHENSTARNPHNKDSKGERQMNPFEPAFEVVPL